MTALMTIPQRNYSIPKWFRLLLALAVLMAGFTLDARAENCTVHAEMDAATRSALQNAGKQMFSYAASGNAQSLAQVSTADIAGNVSGLQQVLDQHKDSLRGASVTVRNVYLLDASDGSGTLQTASFFCGLFNSANKVSFTLPNLPAAKYGLVIMDVNGSKVPYFFSFLLKSEGGSWKMAGLFPKNRQIAGHDAQWYWQQAREYKSRGQMHNAWFHYLVARELASPLAFMSTTKLDTFYDEVQGASPNDLPENNPVSITAPDGKSFKVTNLFVLPDEKTNTLMLVMKYKTNDISDTAKTFLDNKAAMKALLAKYPEFRTPFKMLVARAVAPSGEDFGSMLPMDEVNK